MSRGRHAERDAEDRDAAIAKYNEFHRFDPRRLEWAPPHFVIPARMYRAGKALWVTYRSDKVDPSTLRRPRKPVDYIHEHDAGVITYVSEPLDADAEGVDVPSWAREVDALAKLGECLGFRFEGPDGEEEAQTRAPRPELYTIPSGRCLLVIEGRRGHRPSVAAMMWGGALGVFARGIDG